MWFSDGTSHRVPHVPNSEKRHFLTVLPGRTGDASLACSVRCADGQMAQVLRLPACALLQQAIDGALDAIAILDHDYRFVAVNEIYEKTFRKTHGRDVAPGMSFLDVLSHAPEQRERAARLWGRALAGETVSVTEHFGDDRQGRKRFFEITYSPIRDEAGVVVAAMDCCRDVTDRLVSEASLLNSNVELERRVTERTAALAESENQLRLTLESAKLGTWIVEGGGAAFTWSPRACAIFGLTHQRRITLRRWLALVHPQDRERIAALFERLVQPGAGAFRDEFRCTWPDGSARWVVARGEAHFVEGGGPGAFRIYGTFADITDRKRTEQEIRHRDEALRESEDRFRVAFQTSPDAMAINALEDGSYVAVNEGFTRITGWTDDALRGRTSTSIGIWNDPEQRALLVEQLAREGHVENLEARFRTKDGRVILGLMSARVAVMDGRRTILSVTRDMTDWRRAERERERLEASLHQAAKMEAIGQLAGGIAHDFNNLLAVILSGVQSLQSQVGGSATDAELVADISSAAERARDLTSRLLAFARQRPVAAHAIDVNAVVRDGEKLLRRVLSSCIAIHTRLEDSLGQVNCDPGQLEQLILNLAVNARDAMPGGGELFIETANVDVDPIQASRHPWARAGAFVRLTIRDTGVGMSADVKKHLFEPFFTTKPVGQGTGLGLAIVYGVVKQNAGYVNVESVPGEGTRFDVFLPRIS